MYGGAEQCIHSVAQALKREEIKQIDNTSGNDCYAVKPIIFLN